MPRQPVERREGLFGNVVHIVRMNAHGGVHPVVLLRKGYRRVETLRAGAAADCQQRPHPRSLSPRKHGVAVLVKLRKLQVRVRINNFQGKPS